MPDEKAIQTSAEAIKAVVEAVPIYQDAVQPAAKEVGKALTTVAKTVHVALAPLSAIVWGYERIADYLDRRVTELLKDTPEDRISAPSPAVAGPALEALRFTADEPDLREMYAKLVATAMDRATTSHAHPAYVECIKQLSPDEAKILRWLATDRYCPQPMVTLLADALPPEFPQGGFLVLHRNVSLIPRLAGCTAPELGPSYLDNLSRLGFLEFSRGPLGSTEAYESLEESAEVRRHVNQTSSSFRHHVKRGYLKFTDFGQQFISACVIDRGSTSGSDSEDTGPEVPAS